MAGIWDSNLKRLVETSPQTFIDWLLKGAIFVRELPAHLNRGIYIDMLYEVELDARRVLTHIEFQRHDDEGMERRVLEYNAYATYKFDCPVVSFVIYLRKTGRIVEAPLIKALPDGTEIWRFLFFNIKLWEVPTEKIRQLKSTGLLPLLPLTREGSRPEVVEEVLAGIEQSTVDHTTKNNLLTIAITLATLALDGPANLEWIRKRFVMYQDLIRDTEIYQLIVAEGLEKGLEQGLEKGLEKGLKTGLEQGIRQAEQQEMRELRKTILDVFQIRFPELSSLAQDRVEAIADLSTLIGLIRDMMLTESHNQARTVLEALPTINLSSHS